MINTDERDIKIISMLKENSRMSCTEIASNIGVSEGTVRKRIERLEKSGIITKYTVELNPSKLGYGVTAIVGLDCLPEHFLDIPEILAGMEETRMVSTSTGDHMIMAEVWCKNGQELSRLLSEKIGKIPGVKRMCPAVILERIK